MRRGGRAGVGLQGRHLWGAVEVAVPAACTGAAQQLFWSSAGAEQEGCGSCAWSRASMAHGQCVTTALYDHLAQLVVLGLQWSVLFSSVCKGITP
jgi:hypothetical protein